MSVHEPPISQTTGTTLKMYEYCVALYDAMINDYAEEEINEQTVKVWRGPITNVVKQLDIPQGVYGKLMEQMYHLECITKLNSGSAGIPSVFVLHHSPASVPWTIPAPKKRLTGDAKAAKVLSVEQRVTDLAKALGGLDIVAVMADFQQRMDKLEKQLDAIKRERTLAT